mgnify:CR=1 FL=1
MLTLFILQRERINKDIQNLCDKDSLLKMQNMKHNFLNQDWDIDKYIRIMNRGSPFLMALFTQGLGFDDQQAMLAIQALIYKKSNRYFLYISI